MKAARYASRYLISRWLIRVLILFIMPLTSEIFEYDLSRISARRAYIEIEIMMKAAATGEP